MVTGWVWFVRAMQQSSCRIGKTEVTAIGNSKHMKFQPYRPANQTFRATVWSMDPKIIYFLKVQNRQEFGPNNTKQTGSFPNHAASRVLKNINRYTTFPFQILNLYLNNITQFGHDSSIVCLKQYLWEVGCMYKQFQLNHPQGKSK